MTERPAEPPPGDSADFKQRFLAAQQLHRDGKLEAALAAYQSLLDESPESAPVLHFMGILKYRMGEEHQAVELIERAIEQSPRTYDAYKNLGNIHLECERFESAEACYLKAAELQPDDGALFSNLCVALRNQGRYPESIAAGEKAVRLLPHDALGWYSLANSCAKLGRLRQALKYYEKAVELNPKFVPAWDALGQATLAWEQKRPLARLRLKRTIGVYERWLQKQPGNRVARFMVSALRGDISLDRAPEGFVRDMFDQYAVDFDRRLAGLEYRVPQRMVEELATLKGEASGELDILDAGCGTGLSAAGLRPWAKQLEGVDLSSGMLDRARNLGLYDELAMADLVEFMDQKPGQYDVIIIADTLCYFGELENVFQVTARSLKPNGLVVFSVEWLDASRSGSGYRLHPHGRYRHSEPYLRQVLSSAGLDVINLGRESLRLEKGVPVAGLIVSAGLCS